MDPTTATTKEESDTYSQKDAPSMIGTDNESMKSHKSERDEESYYEEEESYYEEDGEEEEEETDDDEDIDEEPKLKYRRLSAGIRDLLEKDTASTLKVTEKFVVI